MFKYTLKLFTTRTKQGANKVKAAQKRIQQSISLRKTHKTGG